VQLGRQNPRGDPEAVFRPPKNNKHEHKHSKWETWTYAYFQAHRVFSILGERNDRFMSPPTDKRESQASKPPTIKEQKHQETKRSTRYEEQNQMERDDDAKLQHSQNIMRDAIAVKAKVARTAKIAKLKTPICAMRWRRPRKPWRSSRISLNYTPRRRTHIRGSVFQACSTAM